MDSVQKNSGDLDPYNGSYDLHRELFGHERGVRCGCNIGENHLSLLNSADSSDNHVFNHEYLVTGGAEGDVVVWKLTNLGYCNIVSRFMAHVNTVMCIVPSQLLNDFLDMSSLESNPNEELTLYEHQLCVYTCGRDKLIHRVNLAGKKLLTLEGHDDVVCSLHEMPDSSKLVSGSWDGTAIVWDVLSGTQQYRIQSTQYKYSVYVNSLVTGEVVSAMQNGDLCFWNGRNLVKSKKLHDDAIRAVSIKDNYLTCSNDCTIKCFNDSLCLLFSMELHEGFVYDVRHSKEFDVAFSASEDKTVRVWSTKNGQLLQTIALESSVWQVVETTYNGIATIELSGKVTLWKLKPGKTPIQPNNKLECVVKPKVTRTSGVKILDMTLFKKFNSEKAKELILKYSEENKTLLDTELLYVKQFFQNDTSNLRDSYDISWVVKMLDWPVAERLPVFDLIKASSIYLFTEQLFKTRNQGSKVIFSANEALKNSDNPQLFSVCLQMFANLLHPSISRSVMFRHFESIMESVSVICGISNKLIQQPLSVLCQNFAIACVHNNETNVINHIVLLISKSLAICNEDLKTDSPFSAPVSLRHFMTLELLIHNFPQTTEYCHGHQLKTVLESLSKLLIDKKLVDSNSLGTINYLLNNLS
ncbi:uncharacterized protein TA12235 [Theileria annulata]|uniref:PUL domain-containing protein n=1 Tax=Theileria annulata TaxID=5874 RepID=Q4UDX2_THEAN|nr:uncharacterized protein TA12235 [Theileria annulata]CAI74717.1 hypothetical protein, conserved [Theileria annulata]|eukprot:XP_952449.1 hypothetical protein, conserved [Theileria annulata]